MKQYTHKLVFFLFFTILLTCGCSSEPPIKQPAVTVTDIALSDVSLSKMVVNTTVNIQNPNPVGGRLNKVVFDVWYLDDKKPQYLGHGEQYAIDVKENGNTTTTVPVTISNIPALYAIGTLSQKGSIVLMVNGSAFVDVKVTSWEVKFAEEREFAASEFEAYLPVSSLGGINVTAGVETAKDLWARIKN